MKVMSDATNPLRDYQPFIDLMGRLDNRALAMAVAAGFTALVQSSSATIGIVILLASDGFITLEAGIALVLGAMVGTCVTALLSGIGKPREAVQTSLVHVTLNTGTALIWVWFIGDLAALARSVSDDISRQIANAATFATLGSSLLFIGLTAPIATFVRWLVPDSPAVRGRGEPEFLDDLYLETPAEAVERVRLEVGRLGELAEEAVRGVIPEIGRVSPPREAFRAGVEDAAALHTAIQDYGHKLIKRELGEAESASLGRLLAAAGQIAAITDSIAVNLDAIVREWEEHRFEASPETNAMLLAVHAAVIDAISDAVSALRERDAEKARRVDEARGDVREGIEALYRRISQRLAAGGPGRYDIFRLQTQFVELLESLFFIARRVAWNAV
jgi:phosphate:Na+ symporter